MRKRIALVGAVLIALVLTFVVNVPSASAAPTGFYVSGGRLYESTGAEFVMRGVNHAHTWYPARTSSFADVKALGANTVRVVLSSGDRWARNDEADVASVVARCKQQRLICVLEVHDTTGYGEQAGAVSLSRAADYWLSVRGALAGQEKYVIVNIGNEPFGNTGHAAWTAETKAAIGALRAGGFTHTVMVDAPNWGQDWSFTMRDNAASVFAADPQRNTVFSIHMYGVFDTAAEVDDYLTRFVDAGLPILVGEFGHDHSDGNPDEDTILATTQRLRLGNLGWSWSGNGGGVEYLDLATDFDPAALTPWGQRLFNGANGIRRTSREATVFGPSPGDITAPTAPGAPTASSVTATGLTLSWSASTDDTGVAAYEVVRVSGTTETAVATAGATSAAITGLAANTAYTFAVYARDAAGNRSARSSTVTVTTGSTGTSACAVSYRVTNQWSTGFQAEVTVRNTGAAAVNGWALRWNFANGQTVRQMWNATASQSAAEVTATNAPYTAAIAVNGSVGIGFIGSWSGTNAVPALFTLNGSACATP